MDRLLPGDRRRPRTALRRRRRRRRGARDHDHRHGAEDRRPCAAPASRSAAWPRAPACSRRAWRPCSSCSPPTRSPTPTSLDGALRAATARDLRPGRLRRLHVHQRHRAAAGQRRLRRRSRAPPQLDRRGDAGLRRAGPRSWSPTPRAPARTSRSRWSARPTRTTPSRSAGRSPAATCSSARCTARTPTGAGSSPRSAPPPRRSSRTTSTSPINGVWVCRDGAAGEDRVARRPDRPRGAHRRSTSAPATRRRRVWTNDLTAEYVHENSAYST